MKNLFENAKFGDKFVIRNNDNGKEFIGFIRSVRPDVNFVSIITQPKDGCWDIYFDYSNYKLINERKSQGKERVYRNIEVISRYQELIDEKKLNQLANEYFEHNKYEGEDCWECDAFDAFKAGYKKAKEE